MINFKSFAVSTVTAASTLLFVALSTPAQACSSCGIKLNGAELNGWKINGTEFNGLRWNGLRVNGWRINGIRLNGLKVNGLKVNGADMGVESGRVVAVTLPAH